MSRAVNQCRWVAEGRAWCALLVGGPGTGKTHLAAAAMNHRGLDEAYFWSVPDFLAWIKRMVFDQGRDLEAVLQDYRTKDFLLVLDDLGVENQTEWAHEQLYRVLNARYEEELPTIITSNHPLEHLDSRLVSRFRSGLVNCDGRDVR
jgi:DNA replication protein DnaC